VISLLAAAACAALVAAAAPAAASASARAQVPPAPGLISVVAGGVGVPGVATTVALGNANLSTGNCGVAYGGGSLYIGDGTSVRAVSPGNDRLTTRPGSAPPVRSATAARRPVRPCGGVRGRARPLRQPGHRVRRRQSSARGGRGDRHLLRAGDEGGKHLRIAGLSRSGFSGDGDPAINAKLNTPFGVMVDGAGNVVIGDSRNNRIRVIAASTGTFYGQVMTAGNIYTVAGDGTLGYSGDGGPATHAELSSPTTVVPDAAGNLVVTDPGNNGVRVVANSTGTFYGRP
jgi:hypothetical protein